MIAATDEHRTTERLLVGVTVPDGGARWGRSGRQQQPPPALSVAAALQQSSQAPPRQQLPPRQQQPPCHNTQRTQTATWRVAAYTDLLPGRRAGPRHTHTHARKQPQPRISTAIRTQTLHMRAHRQTHGGATYSLRCPRRRVEAYTHPRTHTAAPTHQHHPSGSSGGTSGAAVGRPTGAQHSRHSYSVAADSSQQGPATTSKAAAAGGGAADVPRTLRRHFQADP